MLAHRDNSNYEKWNLEDTAKLVHSKFPGSHTFIVKPSYMHLKTLSSFQNFVESSAIGNPQHSTDYGAWLHLVALLDNSGRELKIKRDGGQLELECSGGDNSDEGVDSKSTSSNVPIVLIGFSKGCVVLNQLVYELASAGEDSELKCFIGRVRDMYWLDGGHNGGSNTWLVHDKELGSLAAAGHITVHAHVTPYQINDEMRVWVGKEHKQFVKKLRELGVNVNKKVHFENEERSIDRHFEIISVFI